jgi:hypothetical protein
MNLATFWATFSKTHLVTLSETHRMMTPRRMPEKCLKKIETFLYVHNKQ